MKPTVLVAGGTGNLGERIIKALIARGAEVRAIVRKGSKPEKVEYLTELGAKVITVDLSNAEELKQACQGASCVVSALAGLHDVIVDSQTKLLDAAIAANVPRFIPSDYSSDFTKLPEGENRNFDLRKEFHQYLDQSPIAATSILNGAFADILSYGTPLYSVKNYSVGYWGDKSDWKIDFTTMDNTADYTAAAAIDPSIPKILRIASFQISPNELVSVGKDVKQQEFKLVPMGSLEDFSASTKEERAANPEGEKELYPSWQGKQYLHSMFSVQNTPLDNNRYPDVQWTSAIEVISKI
ncbi:NmrA family NAD(P)-binding protein [Microcoleus sp. FACHB-1515]|uniref:NmrA family NAD(P)-binding protein n=1 Tax=Cyanophyceae TaxID=3028117 RepID=UPI0016841FFB|nr:NmrA family NAD(P)-binding protein [Microcoleus sp. FACHB-1515]MBD2093314.1 NmrA family NAD(P)-binding protein [Microcoleus sp. FACHB-1515]